MRGWVQKRRPTSQCIKQQNQTATLEHQRTHLCLNQSHPLSGALYRVLLFSRNCVKDTVAGFLASILVTANIVSLAALMFAGDLSAGMPTAMWAMLIGSCIGGIWIALTTSIPPLAIGIDSPTWVVLMLFSAPVSSGVLAAGGTAEDATKTVLLFFTAATLTSGLLLFALGACRLASYFRFVPSFVVSGFLATTGWFLISGGVAMIIGRAASISSFAAKWTGPEVGKLAAGVGVFSILLVLRRYRKAAFAIPIALTLMWLLGGMALRSLGLSGSAGGWYLPQLGPPTVWFPFAAARSSPLTLSHLANLLPELLAVAIVALISVVTKTSSIEAIRQTSADLDCELRAHGLASLIAAPFGGLMSNLQPGTSLLFEHAGSATRMCGVFCALFLGAVAVANLNLVPLLPIFLVVGLVFYLGYNFIIEALWRSYSQRAWLDLLLTAGITIVCINYGYLIGVLVGLVCACVAFAATCARIGVVRSHLTRMHFASYVDRSTQATAYLQQQGDAIQLYWLSGYIFFGSSEGMFERIRRDIQELAHGRVKYVILDFSMVSGADSSAILSFTKLRNLCDRRGVTIVYCSLSPGSRAVFEQQGFFGGKSNHQAFSDLNLALAWCEDLLLAEKAFDAETGMAYFERWLQGQLGPSVIAVDLIAYLERKDIGASQVLYHQGEPAETIDLVADGSLAIDLTKANGENLRVRRIMKHSVVGEMGFIRHSLRSATVSTDGPATLFTVTRENFERLRRERPDLAGAFDNFIMRMLADRVDVANREMVALSNLRR
jgi:SulP family sulfate permease